MKVYEFPTTYKQTLDQRTAQKIIDEESRSNNQQYSIRRQLDEKPDGSIYTLGVGSLLALSLAFLYAVIMVTIPMAL